MDSFPPYNQIDHPAMPKSHLNSLLIILIITFLASGLTLIVLRQISQYDGDQVYIATQAALPSHKPVKEQAPIIQKSETASSTIDSMDGWKLYKNEEYGFEFKYPTYLDVGKEQESINLGTYQQPVKGIALGLGTIVVLVSDDLKFKANKIIESVQYEATNPPSEADKSTGPYIECFNRQIYNLEVKIIAVNCVGEGGPAYYAYIKGKTFDVFYDGYPDRSIKPEDSDRFLSTFKLIQH